MNISYLYLILANVIWGLMAPLGKHAMTHGIGSFEMVSLRVLGGALSFWLASLFIKKEKVAPKDMIKLFGAALFAIVFNQCFYTNGLALSSPINASLITTLLPIVTLVLSIILIKEKVNWKAIVGVLTALVGAVILISSRQEANTGSSSWLGDLFCIGAQFSFALYLILFKKTIAHYNVITSMKWMMTFAVLVILPFSFRQVGAIEWSTLTGRVYAETAWVVFGGTFFSYLFLAKAQQVLKPTIVSMYTNVQPVVSSLASVALGLGIFGWSQAAAALLVLTGVYIVTKNK